MTTEINMEALVPAEMAKKAVTIGVRKAEMAAGTLFLLAVLAGAFIAMGGVFSTTLASGSIAIKDAGGAAAFATGFPFGFTRLLAGLAFCLGLIMVVVGGAELFTGNNLIVIAWASRKVSTLGLLRNWLIVYLGNLVGSVASAVIVFVGKQYTFGSGAVGITALNIAKSKVELGFWQAIALGMLCNALVCMAIWMSFGARSTMDKIAAIIFPISGFVAASFEHSVANMYFIPVAILIKNFAGQDFWKLIGKAPADFASLNWGNFFSVNLLPVTIGNIIGGSLMVGAIYWLIYLRPTKTE